MSQRIAVNHLELNFIEMFRVALSAPTHEERLAAIQYVRHDVTAAHLQDMKREFGPDWALKSVSKRLPEWLSETAGDREDAIYELCRVMQAYEDGLERRLNVAEQVGNMICLSIEDGKFEGVQTRGGILYQVSEQGKAQKISGARDKDTVRKAWRDYRGVVHIGMALTYCESRDEPLERVIPVAENFRLLLSQSCPKGTRAPYVDDKAQISFYYKSEI